MGLKDVFIEKGSHSLCGSQAGLELMEILNARVTGVSHHHSAQSLTFNMSSVSVWFSLEGE